MKLIKTITKENLFYEMELRDYEVFKNQLILNEIKKENNIEIRKYTNFKEDFYYYYDEDKKLQKVEVYDKSKDDLL